MTKILLRGIEVLKLWGLLHKIISSTLKAVGTLSRIRIIWALKLPKVNV